LRSWTFGVGQWAPVGGQLVGAVGRSIGGGGDNGEWEISEMEEILEMNVKCRPPAFSTSFLKKKKKKMTRRKKDGRKSHV
jgi:hypothetical protein